MTNNNHSMTLLEHIRELRQRILYIVIGWVLGIVVSVVFADNLIIWLKSPLDDLAVSVNLQALSPTETTITYFKVVIAVGFGISLPHTLYQLYTYVAPGLYKNEKSVVLAGIPSVIVFFILGALFTLKILIPVSMPVLSGFLSEIVDPNYTLQNYLTFVTTLVVWMGVIFQTPLIVYVISRFGIVPFDTLKKARRIVWFIAVVFAAVVTPTTDPVTLVMVTGPFILLFELGLLFARIGQKQRAARESALVKETPND